MTELYEGKNLIITLTEDQKIEIRVKGTRSDPESIGILEFYEMLSGKGGKSPKTANDRKMISLYDLRSASAISTLEYADKVKFDKIILNMLEINP